MKKLFNLLLFLLISSFTFSEIILDVSNNDPSINEPISLQVKFLDSDKKDYTIDGIENFKIASKGSQSNYSIINGKSTSSKSDIYTIIPLKEGSFTLKVNGKNETSNSININVSKKAKVNVEGKITLQDNLKEKNTFYFGQKIPFEEKLLTTVPLRNLQYIDRPNFGDLSVKDITPANNRGGYTEKYFTDENGKRGLEITLYQALLQANSSGEKLIKGGYVGVTESNPNDNFVFGSTSAPVYLGAKEMDINILPLPAGKPAGFQEIVGELKGDYSWNNDKIKFGESVVLTLKLSGDVNLDMLEKVISNNFSDFNVFESSKESGERIVNGKYYAEKNFEIAFIPKVTGKINIPAIKIPYFDTIDKKYKEFEIPGKMIEVTGSSNGTIVPATTNVPPVGNTPAAVPASPAATEKIDISSIPDSQIEKINTADNKLMIGVIILSLLEAGIIIFLILDRKILKNSSIPKLKQMKKAKDDKEFYNLYCELMKEKFDFSPKAHLEDKLVKSGASEKIIELNREIEKKIYAFEPLDRNEILRTLKKELKG
ncbi:BatD family protein [Fusobacterium sp.]|uniref:BatD family protein n=1 Tax=Fusobacterium sp. TaxID=68766 RepID=UPI0029017C17|nr:BatD family protein [Fusobacterium sp.]MDU1912193.1 BatD family protein [Fusobacterium sp.]